MRVALLNPSFFEVYKHYEKAARIGACYPPTGLLYLAGKLRADGHTVCVIDVGVEGLSVEEVLDRLEQFDPQLVGLTASTPLFTGACELARRIKARMDVPTVVGGIHLTILREEAFGPNPQFDFAVPGEGEITLSELVRCLAGGGDPASVAGLLLRRDGRVVATASRAMVADLDELPLPARDLIPRANYLWAAPGKGSTPIALMFTKRGCPFKCSFCSQHSMFGRNVRCRSIESVLDELEHIVTVDGIHHILFLDDTLVIKRERMAALCEGIHRRRLEFTWEGMARANLVDEELIRMMREAGLVRISFGIESGDEATLQRINKGVTLDQIRQAYKWAKQAGMETRGSAILGHPGETAKTAWKTIRFLRGLKHLDQVLLNVMVPYPGTEVYELARAGRTGYRLLSEDYTRYTRYDNCVIEVNDLSVKRLQRLQTIGLWLFYLTPRRVWHNLRRAGLRTGFTMAMVMLRCLLSRSKTPGEPQVQPSSATT